MIKSSLVVAALLALAVPAAADTLYVAGPPPAAPGHPMHLGADHRATQVGDLVHIVFNFNGSANNSDAATTTNTYSNTLGSTCRSCASAAGSRRVRTPVFPKRKPSSKPSPVR